MPTDNAPHEQPLAPEIVATQRHRERFGSLPTVVIAAPGRVNLIGEHTDYNGGFVLPATIDRRVVLAASPRDDRQVCLHSVGFDADAAFPLDAIDRDPDLGWSNYERGVAHVLQEAGYRLQGFNAVVAGNVPIGSGLSSSAAVEVATAYAFRTLSGLDLDLVSLAKFCQRAENTFVGVNCGIMDQFISAMGQARHALLIDCRSLDHRLVSLPPGMSIVLFDTRVKHELLASQYNERRARCEEGARLLGVEFLREVSPSAFQERQSELPDIVRRRCRHIVTENQRVLDAVAALENGDLPAFGSLMNQSHQSLRDDFEVSCPELDIVVEAARHIDGVYGSRMTGAGFGGCTVSAVKPDAVNTFRTEVATAYEVTTGIAPKVYVCRAEDGVRLL